MSTVPVADQDRFHSPVQVHPDLVKVVLAAGVIAPFPMMVVGGGRTKEDAFTNFGKGRTAAQCVVVGCPASYAQPRLAKVTWVGHPLSSKHVQQPDGYAHAVDLSPVPYEPNVTPHYAVMATAMKAAAHQLGIGIAWGGDWTTTKDFPHFQLV